MSKTLTDFVEEAIRQGRSPQQSNPAPPLPEAQVMNLREIFDRYNKVPYKPGDLVTVCKGCGSANYENQPHIVLEVRPDAEPDFTQSNNLDPTSQLWGARYTMRIATLTGGMYSAFWAESWYFEPYEEPTE